MIAKNIAFNVATITVHAGARVTATLVNEDAGIDHNLTFGVSGLPQGQTCTGPCTTTQTFIAPAPGNYYFLCTIHNMYGTLVSEP